MKPALTSSLAREDFLQAFGALYEHSPWIAERVYRAGAKDLWDDPTTLQQCFVAVVQAASRAEQLALIQAHPDLAGKAALGGQLTADSTAEQAAAGLNACTEAELARFQQLNEAYRQRFGFPFIMAVKGVPRAGILAAFEERIQHSPEHEFQRALREIHRIAQLRLSAIL